jgi:hypothetical protein
VRVKAANAAVDKRRARSGNVARMKRWAWLLAMAACNEGPGTAECFGVCGEGTRCDAGRCVAIAPREPIIDEPDDAKRARKGKRRGRASEAEADATWSPISDREIPRYDPKADVEVGDGSERPDDGAVKSQLRALEPDFDRCIADAIAAGVTVGNGRVEFEFGLTPSGRVAGVNAKAPAAIKDSGVVPCLRKVIYDHRFPKYDGPPIPVDYSFEIG